MTKKIKCQTISKSKSKEVQVRIIQSPLLKREDLKRFLVARAKALVV